jgi:hypothetical protein
MSSYSAVTLWNQGTAPGTAGWADVPDDTFQGLPYQCRLSGALVRVKPRILKGMARVTGPVSAGLQAEAG